MEEVDSISVAVSNIDINKVEALEHRRIAAFINHFLSTTVTFLNQFTRKCESKLDKIQQKLFQIDSALRILECKLESLPEVQASKSNTSAGEESRIQQPEISSVLSSTKNDNEPSPSQNESSSQQEGHEEEGIKAEQHTKQSLREDPTYAKYFKMMYVGVPVQAIKQKMMSEGIDPAILDHP